eukprot:3796588-Prymnesium_polylepis.1
MVGGYRGSDHVQQATPTRVGAPDFIHHVQEAICGAAPVLIGDDVLATMRVGMRAQRPCYDRVRQLWRPDGENVLANQPLILTALTKAGFEPSRNTMSLEWDDEPGCCYIRPTLEGMQKSGLRIELCMELQAIWRQLKCPVILAWSLLAEVAGGKISLLYGDDNATVRYMHPVTLQPLDRVGREKEMLAQIGSSREEIQLLWTIYDQTTDWAKRYCIHEICDTLAQEGDKHHLFDVHVLMVRGDGQADIFHDSQTGLFIGPSQEVHHLLALQRVSESGEQGENTARISSQTQQWYECIAMAQRICRCQTDIQQYAIQAKAWDDRSVRIGRKEHVEPDELDRWFITLGATSDWPDKLRQYQAHAQSDLIHFKDNSLKQLTL